MDDAIQMDFIQNHLVDRRYLPVQVAREAAAWRARAEERESGARRRHQQRVAEDVALRNAVEENFRDFDAVLTLGAREAANNELDGRAFVELARRFTNNIRPNFQRYERRVHSYQTAINVATTTNQQFRRELNEHLVTIQTLAAQLRGAQAFGKVQARNAEALGIAVQNLYRQRSELNGLNQSLENATRATNTRNDELYTQLQNTRESLRVAAKCINSYHNTTNKLGDLTMGSLHSRRHSHDEMLIEQALRKELAAEVRALEEQCAGLQAQLAEASGRSTQDFEAQAGHTPVQPKASIYAGYCKALANTHLKVGTEYLVNPENGQAPLRLIANLDMGINDPMRGNGFFAGIKGSAGAVSSEYELSELNNKLFHSIKVEKQLSPALCRKLPLRRANNTIGVNLLTPVNRDLNAIQALRQGQVDVIVRSVGNSQHDLQFQERITLKHIPQPKVKRKQRTELVPLQVRPSSNEPQQDFAVFEPRQLVQTPRGSQPSSNLTTSSRGSTGLMFVLGLSASVLLISSLTRKFKRNKRASQ